MAYDVITCTASHFRSTVTFFTEVTFGVMAPLRTKRIILSVASVYVAVYVALYLLCDYNIDYLYTTLPPGTTAAPLVTIFTTFVNSAHKAPVYVNTIRVWALLLPHVQPVLYYVPGEERLKAIARLHGWRVYRSPRIANLSLGEHVPVLRHMFMHAQRLHARSTFFAFANADIVFDASLVRTLRALESRSAALPGMLVVGQRINYKMAPLEAIDDLRGVRSRARRGLLFSGRAQDYFIMTRDGMPFHSMPDFVVGRVGYDNWLVATAIRNLVPVIDATRTLTALHQTDADGNFAGNRRRRGLTGMVNYALAGLDFNYSLGDTECAPMYTDWRWADVQVCVRPGLPCGNKVTSTDREMNKGKQ